MSTFVDGGLDEPAFPVSSCSEHQFCGMGLRDYFAAKAMQGLLARAFTKNETGQPFVEWVAQFSYEMADQMLKARGA